MSDKRNNIYIVRLWLLSVLLIVLMGGGLCAQQADDTVRTIKKLDCRLTLDAGAGSWFGKGYAFTGVAPELRYHFNDHIAISGGLKMTNVYSLGDYQIRGREAQSLAPRKGGGRLYEAYLSGEFQLNDRLWLAATLLHIGGTLDYGLANGRNGEMVSATGFFADLHYRTRRGSMLGLHLSYVNDRNGLLAPYLYSPYFDDMFWYGERIGYGFGRSFGFYY